MSQASTPSPQHRHEHRPAHGAGGSCCGSAPPAVALPAGKPRAAFKVRGLDCIDEVLVLKGAVGPLVGGEEHLAFDVLNGRMMVLDTAAPANPAAVIAAIRRTGMEAQEWSVGQRSEGEAEGDLDRRRLWQAWLTAASGLCVLAGLAIHVYLAGSLSEALRLLGDHDGQPVPLPEAVAYALAIAFGVRYVAVKAWYAARRLRPDINLLMVIAVIGAIGIGEWFEAATVAFLFSLSLALESWSVGRARRAIAALLDLTPATVRVRQPSGEEREIPAATAPIGSLFVVRPGERIALDGEVAAGRSAVDQAPITGESVPVDKEPGSEVFAGTINGDGVLEVVSTRDSGDTTIARIIRLVEQAQSRRARAEQWVERFARVYTPAVIVLALAVCLLPPLMFGGAWSEWFYRALVLLVIACPCALVISTPVSIVAALAASARRGVLVKGGSYIEQPAGLKAVAFDKTGTLTEGKPRVVALLPLNGHSEAELLERAAALEARSAHPLARAILAHAAERGIPVTPAAEARALPGKGVTGRFRDRDYWLGSHRYLMERGQDTPEVAERAGALERQGRTVVAIGTDSHVCGLIAIADTLRPDAAATVRALRQAGIARVIMLTGDNRATAEAIGREAGLDEVRAELLPEDKVAAIEELVERHGQVAMIGDGVNDAPAMARASLGIAMGAAGSDAAIETADIALMTDNIARVPWLVQHSRRTLGVIRQNIVFSLVIKAAFVVLTFAGFATLWGAIAADVGASLLVVANALRLLGARPAGTA